MSGDQRRAITVAGAAHALHDGYTDLIYILLPLWQAEFGLSYAALGALRSVFVGAMACFQIPAGFSPSGSAQPPCSRSAPRSPVFGYCFAGVSTRLHHAARRAARLPASASSTQHPIASALVARAFAGPRSLKALGTYNFAGDLGKMTVAGNAFAAASGDGVASGAGAARQHRRRDGGGDLHRRAALRTPARSPSRKPTAKRVQVTQAASLSASRCLLAIGIIDSATRMGFLLFLPFVLKDKGASVQTVGLAMTLVFAGGAAGKLACAFIGARIGVIGTVWLTEGCTAAGILALFPLPLDAALMLLPLIGSRSTARRRCCTARCPIWWRRNGARAR